ncbi:ABC transporter permease [Salinicoccus albus]|uniref:ABC transporter permease n=1 Tax=Salinicoccus albus TaxID=418756 RepID=UPI00035F54CF|nr:ABC transporter permease [Salinicoccus albus]
MLNLISAEMFKLKKNKSFWVILFVSLGLSALMHYLIITDWWLISNTPFDAAALSDLNALSMFVIPIYFNLMTGSLAAFYISTEFGTDGVIKNQILSGRQRAAVYLSKFIVYTGGSVAIAVLCPLLTGVLLNILMGNADIFTGENIMFLVRAFLLFTMQFAAFCAIILLLAIMSEDSGKTIILSILLTLVMFAAERFNMGGILNTIYDYSIFQQFNLVFDVSMTAGGIIEALTVGGITIVVVLVLGMFIFDRKEIK